MNLKRACTPVLLAIAVYMDSILLGQLNLFGSRPDMLLTVIVSFGVLMGGVPAAVLGCVTGLLMDVLFAKAIGLSAITYMIAGAAGGIFTQKFYADNVIIPALTVSVCAFLKEHVMALALLLMGGRFSYFHALTVYIVPCTVLSGLCCVPVHLVQKRAMSLQLRVRGSEHH